MVNVPASVPHDPPADNQYQAAVWLLARHPGLVTLVERVPGAVDDDGDLDLDGLGDAVRGLDAHRAAFKQYQRDTYEPRDDARWETWRAKGPQLGDYGPAAAIEAIAVMSRTEAARLRLLATLGMDRVAFAVADLDGWDAAGLRLIRDWCRVLTAGPSPEDLDALEARFASAAAESGWSQQ